MLLCHEVKNITKTFPGAEVFSALQGLSMFLSLLFMYSVFLCPLFGASKCFIIIFSIQLIPSFVCDKVWNIKI